MRSPTIEMQRTIAQTKKNYELINKGESRIIVINNGKVINEQFCCYIVG
jgi:hypothetical protein